MCEGTESGDLYRSYLREMKRADFRLRDWHQSSGEIPMTAVTDCKSLFDHLTKQGSAPADGRILQLDIQILRDDMQRGLRVRWVATAQMLADSLTKNVASRYLPFVMRVGVLHLVKHPDIEWVFLEEKERDKLKRKQFYLENRAKKKVRQEGSETEAAILQSKTGVVEEEAEEVQSPQVTLAVFWEASSGSSEPWHCLALLCKLEQTRSVIPTALVLAGRAF